MDPRFSASREDLYNLQMEVKQVQYMQNNHAERLLRLEKRQADEASIKSVWNSPFPGVLSGTPQTGPVQMPHAEVFDDLDEQGEQLLGSLHLGPAEEEPVRRGAASRANSVRFDESALHGSNWAGQSSRHSGEFGPLRPGSGLMMERSLSHKSDGRHSSAGHSVHSAHSQSHHSVQSGRASSLGLDNNFAVGDDDDSSFEIPEPPPAFYVLGTVPSIVRCWLTTNFAHSTLLYADVCSGSQKSTVDYSLLKELDLLDEVQREVDGVFRIRLNVYFAEAVVTHHGNRSGGPREPVPSVTVSFEVSGAEQDSQATDGKSIRVFMGSDALRAHSADILFSQNTMTLYGNDRDRLQVPFVRPEDDAVFRNLCTTNFIPGKHKLNANATPFVLGHVQLPTQGGSSPESNSQRGDESQGDVSPMASQAVPSKGPEVSGSVPSAAIEIDRAIGDVNDTGSVDKDIAIGSPSSEPRRESTVRIWGSWRQSASNGNDSAGEGGLLSGYQPPSRGNRTMKVLRPQKAGSTSARTGASYEPPSSAKALTDGRRKSQPNLAGENGSTTGNRWDMKRVASISGESKAQAQPHAQSNRNANTLPRAANPVGVGSAFSWMTPATKPKGTTMDAE
ncbi:hypothetical protein B0T10DRAFT_562129 [Thelonectria olida]|uniref:Ubiquitin carboxyl-terminal hydrolase 19 n=1 Tax=Thelonectria olida TaxID=1576542 RepID=A0A9P9APS4_9HYPO|nr:hypothetical protein B0T10DRAFT_562129 [Thelonectria olida]